MISKGHALNIKRCPHAETIVVVDAGNSAKVNAFKCYFLTLYIRWVLGGS